MKKLSAICFTAFLLFTTSANAGPQTASSTTGTAFIAQIRVYLDEATAVQWADTELLQFINDGMVDISTKTGCYQGSESINLVADTTVEYTPTGNFIEIMDVVCNPASGLSWGLTKSDIRFVGNASSNDFDVPKFYYEFDGKIGVFPAYSSVTTETITVYYSHKPTAITVGQTILTPAVLDHALLYYVLGQAFLLDKRINEAQNYLNLYLIEINWYRETYRSKNETSSTDK